MTIDQHPTPETLAAFGRGNLPDADLAAVADHLGYCTACRQLAAGQPADSFARKLRRPDKRSTASGGGASLTGLSQVVRGFDDLDAPAAVPPELAALTQYADLKELGRGGMGVVYVARNTLMDRTEVLKVANRGLLERVEPGAAERFLREIRSAARLSHPNVVAAYTAIPAGDLLVFAMEYAAGEDLGKVVKRKGPLAVPVACYYAHCAALGLQHAHENSMVHRDIKPGNLILTRVNGKTVVKVLDFGLAKVTSSATDLTGTGKLMGTPDYIAPEQAMDAARADIRADVYSLGCTLYCLLAGRPPFAGAGTWLAVVDAHRTREATPLDVVRPEVPAGLAAAVARMLAKSPADRYPTPGEAAVAVRPFVLKPKAKAATVGPKTVRPTPTAPVPPPRLRVVRPAARRWPRPAGLVLAAALVAALAAWPLRVRTANGTIVVENVPTGAEVLVDDKQVVTLTRDGETVTLAAVLAGPHRLKVVQGGKDLLAADAVVVTVGGEPVRVRMEPPAELSPPPKPAGLPSAACPPTPAGVSRVALLGNELGRDSWAVKGGELVKLNADNSALYFGSPDWADCEFTADVLVVETRYGEGLGLIVRGGMSGHGLYWATCENRRRGIYKWLNREFTVLNNPSESIRNTPLNTWEAVRVRAEGTSLSAWVNGVLLARVSDGDIKSGQVGFRTYGVRGRMRNITVRDLAGKVLWDGLPDLPK